jgi:hypothetical protein
VSLLPGRPDVSRLAGATRVETAIAAAAAVESAAGVVVAEAGEVVDALLAAASGRGPLLLAGPDGLSPAALALIAERGITSAHVVGRAAAADRPATGQLRGAGVEVTAWGPAGADRLAQDIALALDPDPEQVLLASATSWPDTLTAAAVAVRTGSPLLLARPDGTTDWSAVADLTPAEVVVVGGTAALPDAAVPTFLGG